MALDPASPLTVRLPATILTASSFPLAKRASENLGEPDSSPEERLYATNQLWEVLPVHL
jgi:hypothetical protein